MIVAKYTNDDGSPALRWIHEDKVLEECILPKVLEMPEKIRLDLYDRLQDAAERAAIAKKVGDAMCAAESRQIKENVEMFICGWFQKPPRQGGPHADQLKRDCDPEYREYIRLKKKFEESQ